jgi:menaquinone-dependent protoporphyrinogen oxidase
MMRLHGDARRFLATHRDALSSRPVAFFALGPVNDVEKEWEGARRQLKKQLTKFPWFAPISTEVFGGKYDPMKLGFPFNLIPALRKMSPMDARNWEAIRTWATEMAAALQPVLH